MVAEPQTEFITQDEYISNGNRFIYGSKNTNGKGSTPTPTPPLGLVRVRPPGWDCGTIHVDHSGLGRIPTHSKSYARLVLAWAPLYYLDWEAHHMVDVVQ